MLTTPSPRHRNCSSIPCRPTSARPALRAAIELDLFTAIGDGAETVPAIAAQCKASERGTRILCDYLTIIGFLTKTDGRYRLTPDSSVFLSKRSPAYFGGVIGFLGSPDVVRYFDDLAGTVRRGTVPKSDSTVADENPVWQEFARAMVPMMMPPAQAIADILDVGRCRPDARARHRGGARHVRHRDRAAQSAGGDRGGRLGRRAAGRDRERREDGRRGAPHRAGRRRVQGRLRHRLRPRAGDQLPAPLRRGHVHGAAARRSPRR